VCTSSAKGSNEALSSAIQQLNWRECKNGSKPGPIDIYWVGLGFDEQVYSKPGVYAVNKLPGMVELVQKVHLSRIIKRMQLLFPGEFDFYPPTWFLPEQYHQFVGEMTVNKKLTKRESQTYIVKPDTGSQGEGIHLVSDPRDVHAVVGARPAVVQKYIENPILLDGYKFDLRMYVVVARLHPVEIYLCKDGLARLCTVPYEPPSATNINNTLMHLTNYSLNKNSGDFIHTTAANTGSKRTYSSARRSLRKQGYNVDKIHDKIVDVVIKTVLSLIPDVTIWDHVTNKSKLVRSFQILGFDILLTSDEKVHLLEVNSSPSTGIDAERETKPGSGVMQTIISPVDEQIKVPLLRDSLRLIAYVASKKSPSNQANKKLQNVVKPQPHVGATEDGLFDFPSICPTQPEVKENFSIQEVTLLKRAAAVFIFFNGFKTSLRIGATAFRNMARRCRLCEQGSMPAVDILFIDTMRQWRGYTESHQPAGLPFQGFLEALFRLAKSRFRGSTLKEKLESLLSNCE
uniref:Tubulin polyglutamylase TTLL11 n=1 Tax=Ciona intestinalis TaxID=7719 RepID=H2XQ27_CIOIN